MRLFARSAGQLCAISFLVFPAVALAQASDRKLFLPEEVHRIAGVGDLAVSPDGDWVAYTVRTTNVEKDRYETDLHMVSWDGTSHIQLTHTADSGESNPRFSPDGRYLAFIASRSDGNDDDDDPANMAQIWLLNRSGGEAQRLTEIAGGVSGFEWSPDSARLVIVSRDPEEEKDPDATHDTPPPIVVDRYHFKQDYIGYLGNRYTRLYVFDIASKESALLTPGPYDCLLYTSPSPRDATLSRMPSSA